jgi:uncharacterized membrane protein YraQ (UPF0718 family)
MDKKNSKNDFIAFCNKYEKKDKSKNTHTKSIVNKYGYENKVEVDEFDIPIINKDNKKKETLEEKIEFMFEMLGSLIQGFLGLIIIGAIILGFIGIIVFGIKQLF